MKKEISVIVPIFNAQDTLENLFDSLTENIKKITNDFEIILVDDESKDLSWNIIKNIAKHNRFVKGLRLARNCGVDIAINAGLEISKGNFSVIISCDLQDPVDKIQTLYKKIKDENCDVVCSFYNNKHPESLVEKFFSGIYWKIFSFFTNADYPKEEGLYRIISLKAKNFFLQNQNKIKHIKVLHSTGFKKEYVKMKQNRRSVGKSGYNFKKKLIFAVDYLSTYSFKPLLYSALLGLFISLFSFILGSLFFSLKILGMINAPGWTSIVVIISFFFSILFLNLSIISIYLSKNIEETRKAATYIISEKANE